MFTLSIFFTGTQLTSMFNKQFDEVFELYHSHKAQPNFFLLFLEMNQHTSFSFSYMIVYTNFPPTDSKNGNWADDYEKNFQTIFIHKLKTPKCLIKEATEIFIF